MAAEITHSGAVFRSRTILRSRRPLKLFWY